MFDPTIYDNLKVVLEGYIYELDLAHKIVVTNRSDIVDLAHMSREFSMQFQLRNSEAPYPIAEIILRTSMKDFALEMIEGDEKRAGCIIEVNFYSKITHIKDDCMHIENILKKIWNERPMINQTISFEYMNEDHLLNRTNLNFDRKINEDQIVDLGLIVDYSFQSLEYFTKHFNRLSK